ncbi:unnamed protein product, partial [marine sediment metagenome]
MRKCDDKTLLEQSVLLFESKKGLKQIYVTDDGQFFYTENATSYHCRQKGVAVSIITRNMVIQEKETVKAGISRTEVILPKPELKVEKDTSRKRIKTKKFIKDG